MSLYNFIDQWQCPFCKTTQFELQLKYGICAFTTYRIGDKINWSGDERKLRDSSPRLPDGTGTIETQGLCRNSWYDKWRDSNPDWVNAPEPPPEVRKELGCPRRIWVKVELHQDVVRRILFDNSAQGLVGGEW